ncbi:MAG: hypothetical protein PGN15_01105 [Aeromicrobium erythreum]
MLNVGFHAGSVTGAPAAVLIATTVLDGRGARGGHVPGEVDAAAVVVDVERRDRAVEVGVPLPVAVAGRQGDASGVAREPRRRALDEVREAAADVEPPTCDVEAAHADLARAATVLHDGAPGRGERAGGVEHGEARALLAVDAGEVAADGEPAVRQGLQSAHLVVERRPEGGDPCARRDVEGGEVGLRRALGPVLVAHGGEVAAHVHDVADLGEGLHLGGELAGARRARPGDAPRLG